MYNRTDYSIVLTHALEHHILLLLLIRVHLRVRILRGTHIYTHIHTQCRERGSRWQAFRVHFRLLTIYSICICNVM